MGPVEALDPADWELVEGLTAQVIEGEGGGVEVVWRDVETGAHAGNAVLQIRGEEVWWQNLDISPPWQGEGMLTHICSTLLGTFRDRGVKRYVIHDADMTPDNEATYTKMGFHREGDRLVASIAGNAKLNRTAKARL